MKNILIFDLFMIVATQAHAQKPADLRAIVQARVFASAATPLGLLEGKNDQRH